MGRTPRRRAEPFTVTPAEEDNSAVPEAAVPAEDTPEASAAAVPSGETQAVEPAAESKDQPAKSGKLSPYFPKEIQQWENLIVGAAEKRGLPPNLMAALIKKESWFPVKTYPKGFERCPDGPVTPSCTSLSGALGIMQIMPSHFKSEKDGRDPENNIYKGAKILKSYIKKKGGDIRLGLAAYYCGPNKDSYEARCFAYADKVLEWYREAEAQMPK